MALSQIQCLDDNHVNPRTHESKPEYFYCEEQRLAIEALLRDGREAFSKHLESRGLRGFLSEPELETLVASARPFDPDSELQQTRQDAEAAPLSLRYWPELSDTSVPQMDLGWPDSDTYKGVTRTSVYTQPPLDGEAHIKEVVRKTIAQAQKVIAVVMDAFTDVDIFRDLLDAGFKRKVSVYILLEHTTLHHFLSMCQRASMHAGHLKHLRVRCTGGAEFYSRNCTKVRGRMGHRFMLIDGDKAVSGSYSFTWMSSRLDRHLITVITGQGVNSFDHLFRYLYLTSTSVDLQSVITETEPEPEPNLRPQPVTMTPSSAVARKLYNPKYALVALCTPGPVTSSINDGPKDIEISEKKKKGQSMVTEDLLKDAPPLHPGLTNLEKACLISYLPTWPEPDPPSDVIGFINIRDANKPTQVHLQRSERFGSSQAIKFSSPLSKPQEMLPEITKPRQLSAKLEENHKLEETKSDAKFEMTKDEMKLKQNTVEASQKKNEDGGFKLKLSDEVNTNPGNNATDHYLLTQSQIITKAPISDLKKHLFALESNSSNVCNPRTLESHCPETTKPQNLNLTQQENALPHADSDINAVNIQPETASEMKEDFRTFSRLELFSTPSTSANKSECSTLLSKNNLMDISTVQLSIAATSNTDSLSTSCPSVLPYSVTLSSTPPLFSSSTLLSPAVPSIPKSQTPQLILNDNTPNSEMPSEICAVMMSETSLSPQVFQSAAALSSLVKASPETAPETQNNKSTKVIGNEDIENSAEIKGAPQETECVNSLTLPEKKTEGQYQSQKDVQSINESNLQTQTAMICHELGNDTPEMQSLTFLARSHEPQIISYNAFPLRGIDSVEPLSSSKASVHCESHNSCITKENAGGGMQTSASDTLIKPGKKDQVASLPFSDKQPTRHSYEDHTKNTQRTTPATRKALCLNITSFPTSELNQQTTEPERKSLAVVGNAPVTNVSTPPTPTSDEYFSPRETLSSNSEEYYECGESSFPEFSPDPKGYHKDGTQDPKCANMSQKATTVDSQASDSNTTNQRTSCSDGQSDTVVVTSSALWKKGQNDWTNRTKENSDDKIGMKTSSLKWRKEQQYLAINHTESKEASCMAKQIPQEDCSLESAVKGNMASDRPNDQEKTAAISAWQKKEPKQLSTCDLKPENVATKERKTEKAPLGRQNPADRSAIKPGDEEVKQKQPTKQTQGQKPFHVSPKSQRQQQGSRGSSPSRPPRSPRTSSGSTSSATFPSLTHERNPMQIKTSQAGPKALDTKPNPRRSPSRPPSPLTPRPVGTVGGRQLSSQSQSGISSLTPPAAQIKPRVNNAEKQTVKAQTQSNCGTPAQKEPDQAPLAKGEEKSSFSLSFSRLYSFRGLKDKWTKLPAQSRKGSGSAPVKEPKSTG